MKIPILQTKLYISPPRPNIVARPRLIDRLNAGLHCKLILVSAPAGYGKTTLVTDWVHKIESPTEVIWLALDEEDNDPQLFFSYLAEAIKTLPGVQTTLSQLLQSPRPLPVKYLAKGLVADLTGVTTPFLLILDDYHAIESMEIEQAMADLLNWVPAQMTLVITTRSDPAFPISRLRAQGELIELRVDDLRFTVDEAAAFLEGSMGIALSPEQVNALETRAEGWIAGLQMAALSMRGRDDVDSFIAGFTGSHRYIMDYLADEVLAQATPSVQEFLLQTSVLTRLSAPLCNAVLDTNADEQKDNGEKTPFSASLHHHSGAILEQIERTNLFLVPLDDERRWYRYHHLFAELLSQKLPAERAKQVRQRAAAWSEKNNLFTDAIEYSLGAADFDTAARLLEKHGLTFLFQGKLNRLQRWLDAFPKAYLARRPRLCIHYAWTLLNQGRTEAVESHLLAAENAAPEDTAVRAVTALIRGNIARAHEDIPTARSEAQVAFELADPDNAMTRGAALFQLGAVQLMTGNITPAIDTLKQATVLAQQARNLNVAFLVGGYLGLGYLLQESSEPAEEVLRATMAYAAELGLLQSPLLAYVHIGLAHLAFSRNNLAAARSEIKEALTHCQVVGEISGLRRGYMLLAQIEQADGQFAAAHQAFEQAQKAAQSLKNPEIEPQMALLKASLSRREKNIANERTLRFLAMGAPLDYAQAVSLTPAPQKQPLTEPLSERELEILGLIAAGLKNKEIAGQLFISLNTVLYHTKNIYGKLGVNKRALAIAKARELDLL